MVNPYKDEYPTREPSKLESRNSERKTPESSGRRSRSWSKYALDPRDDVTTTMMAKNELTAEIDSKSNTLLSAKSSDLLEKQSVLKTTLEPAVSEVKKEKPMTLMERMQAAINEEAQKEEEEKKKQEEAIKQQQGRLSDTNTDRLQKSLDNQNFHVFTLNFSRNAL